MDKTGEYTLNPLYLLHSDTDFVPINMSEAPEKGFLAYVHLVIKQKRPKDWEKINNLLTICTRTQKAKYQEFKSREGEMRKNEENFWFYRQKPRLNKNPSPNSSSPVFLTKKLKESYFFSFDSMCRS